MIAILAPLFTGELALYRDALVLADDPRPSRPIADWLAPTELDKVLRAYGDARSADEFRGLASEWSNAYLLRLLPPVIAATLVLRHRLPLALADMELVLGEAGQPLSFKLPDAGQPWPDQASTDDPFRRLATLIDEHLQPLIAALSRHSRLSPRVFWSNAANYIEWLVEAIAVGNPAADVADARAMLLARQRADGRDNPLYRPVRYRLEGEGAAAVTRRRRRVCCVRYLLPDLALCGNCPLTAVPGNAIRGVDRDADPDRDSGRERESDSTPDSESERRSQSTASPDNDQLT
jgi:ferric iron reductase protein FhuF